MSSLGRESVWRGRFPVRQEEPDRKKFNHEAIELVGKAAAVAIGLM